MSELFKCSKCRSSKLAEFYTIKETTGVRYKCCNDCRVKVRCTQCDKEFAAPCALKTHIKTVHDAIKDQQCPNCEYKCTRADLLLKHVESVHQKIKNEKCPTCEFVCYAAITLKIHIQTVHEQILNQQCPHCEYKCSPSGDVRKHIKVVHDQIRDKQCPKCDHMCSMTSDLTKHIKVCTGRERMSAGEYAIKGVLESMQVAFVREMRFHDCRDSYALPFDFYIPLLTVAIEYDGQQHFEAIEHFGGAERLEVTKRHDAIKTQYCLDNGIRLLRIKYTEFERVEELIKVFLTASN